MCLRSLLKAVLLLLVMLNPADANDGKVTLNGLSPDAFIAHPSKSSWYSEQWSLSLWADNGYYVHVQFIISNVGMGSGKGAVKVEVTKASGERASRNQNLGDDWQVSSDRFNLKFGSASLSGQGSDWQVTAGDEQIRVDLKLTPLARGFLPGNKGNLASGSHGRYDLVLLAPILSATGTLTIGGEKMTITARGMADHSWTTIRPDRLAKNWLKFKFFTGDLVAIFAGFTTPGSDSVIDRSWLWVAQKSEPILQASNVQVQIVPGFRDTKTKAGYVLPSEVRIVASDATPRGTIRIMTKGLLQRKDMLNNLSWLERAAVGLVSEPIDYVLNGDFTFQIEKRDKSIVRLTQNNDFVMHFINP